jgi:uroporphyrinogen-III synthase
MMKQSIAEVVPVLLTRPALQSQIFATAMFKRFGDRVCPHMSSLMAPQFLSPEVPAGDFGGVIFTSVMGVAGATQLGVTLPRRAFCVGRRTATVAEAAGFVTWSADSNADGLVAGILADRSVDRLLYIRGVDTTGDIEERLNSEGVTTVSLQVYRQVEQTLTADAVGLLRTSGDVIVPLFSPRGARIFRKELPTDAQARLHVAAMSAAVAEALADLPRAALVVASQPDAKGMLDALESLLGASSLS